MSIEPILFIPDCHRPYHDKRAWKLLLNVAKDLKLKHIVILGDFADFFSISDHSKNPDRAGRLREEIEDVNYGLDELDALGARHKIFIAGNHCDRLRRYLEIKAPELFGLVDIPELFNLKARGWNYIPYKQHVKLGKLWITHDVGTAGANAHKKALDTFQHSVVTGHTHRLAYIVEGDATGETKLSTMLGWLGDVNAINYITKATAKRFWALAFGIGYLDTATSLVYVNPIPIVKYTCCINGKIYKS